LPIGWLFSLGSLSEHYRYLDYFFHGKSYVVIFTKNWIGLHFGWLFYKRIWSPCWPHWNLLRNSLNSYESLKSKIKSFFQKRFQLKSRFFHQLKFCISMRNVRLQNLDQILLRSLLSFVLLKFRVAKFSW
jgi:hypothetical protein